MALTEPPMLDNLRQTFSDCVRELAAALGIAGFNPDMSKISSWQVFILNVKNLSVGTPVARMAGWQCLTTLGNSAVAGEVRFDSSPDSETTFTGRMGEEVNETLAAYRKLGELTELQGNEFEVRVLRIPEVQFDAYWMQAKPVSGAVRPEDWIYPVVSLDPKFPEKKLMKGQRFLQLAKDLAASLVNAPIPLEEDKTGPLKRRTGDGLPGGG